MADKCHIPEATVLTDYKNPVEAELLRCVNFSPREDDKCAQDLYLTLALHIYDTLYNKRNTCT